MVRSIRSICLMVMAVVMAASGGQPVVAGEDDVVLPAELQRLVIFEPDPGRLIYHAGIDHRTLMYVRTSAWSAGGGCPDRSAETWAVWIADHGADIAAAGRAYAQFRDAWQSLPGITAQAAFEAADEGIVFEIDAREVAAASAAATDCGRHGRDTLFRIGGRVVFTSEECWNEVPLAPAHLAQNLSAQLGWRQ